jgi:hypothetical protein
MTNKGVPSSSAAFVELGDRPAFNDSFSNARSHCCLEKHVRNEYAGVFLEPRYLNPSMKIQTRQRSGMSAQTACVEGKEKDAQLIEFQGLERPPIR